MILWLSYFYRTASTLNSQLLYFIFLLRQFDNFLKGAKNYWEQKKSSLLVWGKKSNFFPCSLLCRLGAGIIQHLVAQSGEEAPVDYKIGAGNEAAGVAISQVGGGKAYVARHARLLQRLEGVGHEVSQLVVPVQRGERQQGSSSILILLLIINIMIWYLCGTGWPINKGSE